MTPENHSLGRREAADLVGITDLALKSLVSRDGLFSDRVRTRGTPLSWTIREVIQLAAVVKLMEIGLPAKKAVAALSGVSINGALLERGEIDVWWNGEKWRSVIGHPGHQISINIPLWPIFEEVIEGWRPANELDLEWLSYCDQLQKHRSRQGRG